uniref:NADH-ubiquinone oxidoreductase chain 4 n=1 Tax=Dryinus sp. ZJUH_2016011 TaxID=2491175 RepID=A0A3S8V0K5_9HYME|nr:NADH dehydrogenase subunit 4 [Dryinus sp. ZJUH_2016011]
MMKLLFFILFMMMNLLIFNLKLKFNFKLMKLAIQNSFLLLITLFFFFFFNEKKECWLMLSNQMGYDYLSWSLIFLLIWIFILMFISLKMVWLFNIDLFFWLLLLFIFIMLTFLMMNIFMFYFFFEVSLIPILIMIMGWGSMEDRISASFYMLLYTLFSSLPLLIILFYLYNKNYSLFYLLLLKNNKYYFDIFFYCFFFGGFFVKMPMYLIHLWLPKAHVEAPLIGSMILAGVLLKLGSYGLYRFMILIKMLSLCYNYIFMSVSLVGMLNVSLICLRQIDLKMLVAYSSVVHMGLLMSGMFSLTYMGFEGSLFMMIAHGLCSSGLFCLVNIIYERSMSRSLLINKGMMNIMPLMSMWWFLLCSSNFSAPISLNLVGEIFLLSSLILYNKIIIFYLVFACFFSASYSLYLFSVTQHGKFIYNLNYMSGGNLAEFMLLIFHWFPLNLLTLNLMILI